MAELKKDLAVIGGGPAGYVAAIKAAQLGASVVLFERGVVGGTCLNRGCLPTKTYLKTAEYLHHIRTASDRGIVVDATSSVDMPKVVLYKNKVVKTLTSGVAGLLKSSGVEVVKGEASMQSETEIVCDGKVYEATSTILCGGSMAGRLPIPGVEHPAVLTSDELLDITYVPKRLCVIGGGVIGCEMACAFQAFGSQVTIIELADRPIPTMDEELSKLMKKSLQKLGIKVLVGQQVSGISGSDSEPVVSTATEQVVCDLVLLSIGRVADLACLGALKDKIKTERGKVVADNEMRTNLPNIYACGDLNGKLMLAHSAFKMGEIAAENAVKGGHQVCNLNYVPSCVYTIPEAASVGLSEAQAKEKLGERVSVGRFPYSANGRAVASGETVGFIKVSVDLKYGEILGVQIFGDMATELIAEPASLMSMEITANEVADIIHGHPTYSEAFMEACADALGRCIHLPAKRKR